MSFLRVFLFAILFFLLNENVINAQEATASSLRRRLLNDAPSPQLYPEACEQNILWGHRDHGGWFVCMDAIKRDRPCIVYSFGLGADWSFDNDAEHFGCEVHGFDPTNRLWREGMHGSRYSRFNYAKHYPSQKKIFHNWGIGSLDDVVYPPGTFPQDWPGLGDPPFSKTNTEPWNMKSVERTMDELHHRYISILKIDVEGSEWTAIAAMLESEKMRALLHSGGIEQLLLEYHWNPSTTALNDRYDMIMKRIESFGFVPWKIERHKGSDCCLDMSYIWKKPSKSLEIIEH